MLVNFYFFTADERVVGQAGERDHILAARIGRLRELLNAGEVLPLAAAEISKSMSNFRSKDPSSKPPATIVRAKLVRVDN